MKDGMKRVEGYNDLYRNERGAIVNTDKQGYEAYIRRRAASKKKDRKVTSLEEELITTKKELEEIKELVKQLLNKQIQ